MCLSPAWANLPFATIQNLIPHNDMNTPETHPIQLISSDLNGTLVHQHTMMDMIRVSFPREPERYEKAQDAFARQTAGTLSMQEAFARAGPLTKGLSLRKAIEYAQFEIRFLPGFKELISAFLMRRQYFVINSTGYTVTTEAIKLRFGPENFFRVICNQLVFGWDGDPSRSLTNGELMRLIKDYEATGKDDVRYDQLLATGEVLLGIKDEAHKASELFRIADLLSLPRSSIAHIGDTMGDSAGIADVARNGGLGIAFNYNEPLREYLESVQRTGDIPGRIELIGPKGSNPDLRSLLEVLGAG
jgi:phosphoserine phosphatase